MRYSRSGRPQMTLCSSSTILKLAHSSTDWSLLPLTSPSRIRYRHRVPKDYQSHPSLVKMKVTLLAAGLVATVFAQDLSTIPECARTCLTDAIAQDGKCQATDSACVCGRIDALTSLATGCVLSACGQDVALSMQNPTRPRTLCLMSLY